MFLYASHFTQQNASRSSRKIFVFGRLRSTPWASRDQHPLQHSRFHNRFEHWSADQRTKVTGSPFLSLLGGSAIGIDPAGKFLFMISDSGAHTIAIDANTGSLSEVAGSPG